MTLSYSCPSRANHLYPQADSRLTPQEQPYPVPCHPWRSYPGKAASGPRQGENFSFSSVLTSPLGSTLLNRALWILPRTPGTKPFSLPSHSQAPRPGPVTAWSTKGSEHPRLQKVHRGMGRRLGHVHMLTCLFLLTVIFTQHKINHSSFKMYNPVVLNILTILCNHYLHLVQRFTFTGIFRSYFNFIYF